MKNVVQKKEYVAPETKVAYVETESCFCGSVFEDKDKQDITIEEHGFSQDALINGGKGVIYEDNAWTN